MSWPACVLHSLQFICAGLVSNFLFVNPGLVSVSTTDSKQDLLLSSLQIQTSEWLKVSSLLRRVAFRWHMFTGCSTINTLWWNYSCEHLSSRCPWHWIWAALFWLWLLPFSSWLTWPSGILKIFHICEYGKMKKRPVFQNMRPFFSIKKWHFLPSTDWDCGTCCADGWSFSLWSPLLLVVQSQTVQIRLMFWAQTGTRTFCLACKMWPCSLWVNIRDETFLWPDSAVVSYVAFQPGCEYKACGNYVSASLTWKKKRPHFFHFCVSFFPGGSGSLSSALLLPP